MSKLKRFMVIVITIIILTSLVYVCVQKRLDAQIPTNKYHAKLTDVLDRYEQERKEYTRYFIPIDHRLRNNILEISRLNLFLNRKIKYKEEPDSQDYWQTPWETISKGTGDCEDYAIMKFITLIEHGVPAEDLNLVLAINKHSKRQHSYIKLNFKNKTYYLDNLSDHIGEEPKGYQILYEINRDLDRFILHAEGLALLMN